MLTQGTIIFGAELLFQTFASSFAFDEQSRYDDNDRDHNDADKNHGPLVHRSHLWGSMMRSSMVAMPRESHIAVRGLQAISRNSK